MIGLLFDSNLQFQDKNGSLLTDGILNVYYNSSTDTQKYPAKTYADSNGSVLNPLDIRLDNNGRALVYVPSDYFYRLEVYDSDRNLLWTTRGIQPNNGIAIDGTKIISINGDEDISVESSVDGNRYTYQLGLQDEIKAKFDNIVTKQYVDAQDNSIKQTLNSTAYDLQMKINTKQDRLTPGDHIEITEDNTINVVGEFGKVYTGISPVNVDNTRDEISVQHKTLNVSAPLTFDKSSTTLGFDDSAYAKKTDIPTDFYTKSEVDAKDSALDTKIGNNATAISLLQDQMSDKASVDYVDGKTGLLGERIDDIDDKFDDYYDKDQIDGFLRNWSGFVVVPYGQSLPDADKAELGKIYLWQQSTTKSDNYSEWISDGSQWSKIGEMSVSLDNYYTKNECNIKFLPTTYSQTIEAEVAKKLEKVAVDGKTVTGDGTSSNPLKASIDNSSAFTIEGVDGITITDDAENKKTKISGIGLGNAINNLGSMVVTNGSNITALQADLAHKQNTLTSSNAGTGISIEDGVISAEVTKPIIRFNVAFTNTSTEDGIKTWTSPTVSPSKYSAMMYMLYVSGANFTADDKWDVILNGSNWTTGIRGNFSTYTCTVPTSGVTFTVKTPSTVTNVRFSYVMWGEWG